MPYMRTELEQTACMRAEKMCTEGLLKRKRGRERRPEERTQQRKGKDFSEGITHSGGRGIMLYLEAV